MNRSLRLAALALFMGAGVVVAAPVVTSPGRPTQPLVDKSASRASHPDFVLHVDRKSGCVWRVSTLDGTRNGDRLPCARSKSAQRQASGSKRTE
jgi:hypothetical protein